MVLRVNYRNTSEIVTAAGTLVPTVLNGDPDDPATDGDVAAVVRHGRPAVEVRCADVRDLDAALLRDLAETARRRSGHAGSAVLCRQLRDVGRYAELLRRHGLPVQSLEEYAGDGTEAIKVGTYKRARGGPAGRLPAGTAPAGDPDRAGRGRAGGAGRPRAPRRVGPRPGRALARLSRVGRRLTRHRRSPAGESGCFAAGLRVRVPPAVPWVQRCPLLSRGWYVDPMGSIVEALVTGAATGATTVGGKVVTASYDAFRKRLRRRLGRKPSAEVERLLADPEAGRPVLEQRLAAAGVDADPELVELARRVLAERGSSVVNAPHSQGVQSGSGNTQNNTWNNAPAKWRRRSR